MIKKNNIEKTNPEKITCPSCGRRVEKKDFCTICGASFNPKNRTSLKSVIIFIWIMGAVGIGMLGYGYYNANYITPIDQITADMEGQTVQVSGTVLSLDYNENFQLTSFLIKDDTGTIEFFGWSEFTSDIKENGYPGIGDEVIIEGVVSVYEEEVSIELEDSDSLTIIEIEPEEKEIKDLSEDDIDLKIEIQGNVTDEYPDSQDITTLEYKFFTVDDGTGEITVFIGGDQISFTGEKSNIPNINDTVRIIGIVDLYNEELEIIPSYLTDDGIKIL